MKGYIHITRRFEKAYVIFTDNTDLWWLRLLKPGFRHCYLLLSGRGGRCWLELNPCSDQIAGFLGANSAIRSRKKCCFAVMKTA